MTSKTLSSVTVAAMLAVMALAGTAIAGAESEAEGDLKALSAAKISLGKAVEAAEAKSGGKAFAASFRKEDGAYAYEVEVVDADKTEKVLIAPSTGEVVKVEVVSEDLDGDGDGM